MISVIDALKKIIKSKPMIEESLKLGILNLSKFAELIQPEVENMLYKKVQKGALITALSRLQKEDSSTFEINFQINDISMKAPISEIVYHGDQKKSEKISNLYHHFQQQQNHFLNIISGNTEIGIFVNSKYTNLVLDLFKKEKPIRIINNLVGVSLKFSEEFLEVPGVTYQVLKTITWEGINLVEIISTYTELTLILSQKDAQKAFSILSQNFLK